MKRDEIRTIANAILGADCNDMSTTQIINMAELICIKLETQRALRECFERDGHYKNFKGVMSPKEVKIRNKGEELVGIPPMVGLKTGFIELIKAIEASEEYE